MSTSVTQRLSAAARAIRFEHIALVVLAGIAIGLSFLVRHEVFSAYSWNRDEPVYLWQMRVLDSGSFTGTDGGAPAFFHPWLTGLRDGKLFSQYGPGWTVALLASDKIFGSPGMAVALSAALAILGTYAFARTVTQRREVALVAAAVMTVSPLLVLQSGLYLGYLYSLGLGLFFAALVITGIRGSPWMLVVGGVLLGVIFLTRPFDAVLWAAPIALYLIVTMGRAEARALLRGAAWTAVGLLPLFVAGLLFNKHITGSFTEFPITAKDPADKFGFGVRHIMPRWTPVNYTVWRAFRGTGRNLFFLPQFLFGSYLAVVVSGWVLWLRRRERSTLVLVALGASFVIGYFFFWGIYLSGAKVSLTGPIYFIPLFAPISVLIAFGLRTAWDRRRALGIGLTAVLLVATVPFLVDKIDDNRGFSDANARWRESAESIEGRALVIVDRSGPYLLHLNPYSANAPKPNSGRILYAADLGPSNLFLIDDYPDRTPYLQSTDVLTRDSTTAPPVPHISVQRIRVVSGSTVTVDTQVTNETDHSIVTAYLRIGPDIVSTRVLDDNSAKDERHETSWKVAIHGARDADATVIRGDTTEMVVGITFGKPGDEDAVRFEEEFSYRVIGSTIDVLTPGRMSRLVETRHGTRARRADTRRIIDVTVRQGT